MSNIIASPGVQLNEIDLSYNVRTTNTRVVSMLGYTVQGPMYEPIYVTSLAEFENIFGSPTNSAERYLYHSARQILQKTRSQLIVTRLPYDVPSLDITDVPAGVYKHSVLVFPVSANATRYDTVISETVYDLENATEYTLLEPQNIIVTKDQYDNILQNNFDWTQTLSAGTGVAGYTPIGLVITNDMDAPLNNLYEGYYVGLADNYDINPATGYDNITAVKSVNGIPGKLNVGGYTNTAVAYTGWTTLPEERLTFKLYETPSTLGLQDTISEIVIKYPTRGFSYDSSEYNDTLTISLFSLRKSVYEASSVQLAQSNLQSFAGSFNSNKKRVGTDGGAPRSAFVEDVVNDPSPYLSVFVNPLISKSNWENASATDSTPAKTIRVHNNAKNLYSLGVYGVINEQSSKQLGDVPDKVSKALRIMENAEEYPLDITCDAGLSTIWTGIKCKNVDSTFIELPNLVDSSFNDEEVLGYIDGGISGPKINALFGKTATNPTERSVIVDAHNSVATLFTEFSTLTRRDHVHISDPLRYIFVEGRNFKKVDRKPDSSAGGFSFSNEIYWPMAHLYSKISSSYAATYPTWFKTSDGSLRRDIWMPPSAVVAATIVNSSPFDAPAGFTRGVITGLIDTAISPNQKQRDLLYKDSFNSVAVFPGEGIIVFGQKTLLNKPSAFDRLNVRRTFLFLEKAVSSVMKYFVFEGNTYITRTRLVSTITPVFESAKTRNGIYDYKIVCDERNNTPDTIDNNELVVDIYIKPVRTAEFILVNFYATRTSQNFSELVSG